MRKILLFLCLCMNMSILAQEAPFARIYTAQDYINKGNEQYVKDYFLGASYNYEKAIEIDPQNYDAYCFLGQSLADVARSTSNSNDFFHKAFRAYKKATQIEKSNPSAYNSWGIALTDYARRNNKLNTYAPQIKELLEKTIQLGSQYGAYNMACLYSLLNEKENAIKWLYITMDPSFTKQMHNLGCELFEKDSDFKNINQTSEFTYFLDKYFSDYDGLTSPEKCDTFFSLAGEKHAKWFYLQACKDYEKLWLHGYKHRNLLFDWASAYSAIGDYGYYKEALEIFKLASKENPEDYRVYNDWGVTLMFYAKSKNMLFTYSPQIKELFEKVIKLGADQSGSYNMACLYSLCNEKANAMKWLRKAVYDSHMQEMQELNREKLETDSDLDNIRGLNEFREMLWSYFYTEKELEELNQMLKEEYSTAIALLKEGEYEEAYLYFEKRLRYTPDSYGAYYSWATGLSKQAQETNNAETYKASISKFKKALELKSNRADGYNNLAVVLTYYAKSENKLYSYFPQIKELLEKAIELGADQSGAYNMACLYSLCNEKANAMKWLNKAVLDENKQKMQELNREKLETDSDLDNIRDLLEFKQLLWTRFYTREEVKELNQMLKDEYDMAIALLEEGEYEEAYPYFEKRLRYIPDSYGAYYSWATGLSKQALQTNDSKTYKASIDKFKKAIKLKPDRARYNNMGVAMMYYAKSKNKLYTYSPQIKELYEKVIEFGDQIGAYNMACLYSLLNEKENAIKWLEKMMDDHYDEKMSDLTLAKIEADSDFDNIRYSYEFNAFILSYFYTITEIKELESSINIEFTQAQQFYKQKNYDAVCSYFNRINRYVTENHDAYLLWASALLGQAEETNDAKKYEASIAKFKKSIKIDPNRSNGYNRLGVALMYYAKSKNKLYTYSQQIKELYEKVTEFDEQTGVYNMACLYSLLNEKENAMKYLNSFFFMNYVDSEDEKEVVTRKQFDEDPDFDNIRNSPEFKNFLDLCFPVSINVIKLSQPRSHPTILAPASPSLVLP